MVRTTIRFGDTLLKQIKEKVYTENKSINTVVIELINKALGNGMHDINKIKTDKFVKGDK